MSAAAQPTPVSTWIALKAQFFMQAPHSMHASLSANSALLFLNVNAPCGQTSTHRPHPLHKDFSYRIFETFRM
jgi:hypothetical protein